MTSSDAARLAFTGSGGGGGTSGRQAKVAVTGPWSLEPTAQWAAEARAKPARSSLAKT